MATCSEDLWMINLVHKLSGFHWMPGNYFVTSWRKLGKVFFESQVIIKRHDCKVFVPLAQYHLVTKPWGLSPQVSDPWKVLVCNYTKCNLQVQNCCLRANARTDSLPSLTSCGWKVFLKLTAEKQYSSSPKSDCITQSLLTRIMSWSWMAERADQPGPEIHYSLNSCLPSSPAVPGFEQHLQFHRIHCVQQSEK